MTLANSGSLIERAHPRIEWSIPPLRKRRYTRTDWIPAVWATNGTTPPSRINQVMGASGNVVTPALSFAVATQNEVGFIWALPTDADPDYTVTFRLFITCSSLWTVGNYMWTLEYLLKSAGDSRITGTPTTITADYTPTAVNLYATIDFATTITMAAGQNLIGHFYRDVANDNGDAVGLLLLFGFQYEAFKTGANDPPGVVAW